MSSAFLLALCIPLYCSEEPSLQDSPESLVDRLRSPLPDVREDAQKKLKALGEKALPALRKAAEDPDRQVRERVRALLRLLEVRGQLTPGLLKVPGLDERLAAGGGDAWMKAIRESSELVSERGDLDALLLGGLAVVDRAADRIDIIQLIGFSENPRFVASLRKLLKDGDARVRIQATRKIGHCKGWDAAPEILALLSDPDADVRVAAAASLSELQVRSSVDAVVPLLKDRESRVRMAAVGALEGLRARRTVRDLLPLLSDPDPGVRTAAACTLGGFGAREAAPALVALLKDKDEWRRMDALSGLEVIGARETWREILPLLKDPHDSIPSDACRVLGSLGASEAAPALVEMLGREHDAERSLGILRARDVVPAVLKKLDAPENSVRNAACRALGQLDATGAAPQIVKLLRDPDADLRKEAVEVLAVWRAREHAPSIRRLLKDPNAAVRGAAAAAMGYLGVKEAVPELREMLSRRGGRVRAMEALLYLQAKEALPDLRKLASDPPGNLEDGEGLGDAVENVRQTAIVALARLGGLREAAAIRPHLRSDNSFLSHVAFQMAAEIGDKEALADLRAIFRNSEEPGLTREAAGAAMCELGEDEGVPLLLERQQARPSMYLNRLNFLRCPEATRELRSKTAVGVRDATRSDFLERLALASGRPAVVSADLDRFFLARLWYLERDHLRKYDGFVPLLEALDYPVSVLQIHYVVESDKLRFQSSEEALAFWRSWWSERKKK